MNIEELNKTQIILLTLLVSFITSIATGIVTVSLVEQAPPGFTQTVNRVVERTVERVVPDKSGGTTVKETTVVVKEEDLITKSIEKLSDGIVGIKQKTLGSDGSPVETFLGWGTVLRADGIIATDSNFISDDGSYVVEAVGGKKFAVKTLSQDEDRGIALLKVEQGDEKTTYTFTPVSLGDSENTRLGQTVVAFGGNIKRAVSIGIVSSISKEESGGDNIASSTPLQTKKITSAIEASIAPVGNFTGGPLANIFGEVIGMSVNSGGEKANSYTAINFIKEKLAAITSQEKKAN